MINEYMVYDSLHQYVNHNLQRFDNNSYIDILIVINEGLIKNYLHWK